MLLRWKLEEISEASVVPALSALDFLKEESGNGLVFILSYSSQFSVTQSCLSPGVGVGTGNFEAWPDPRQIFSSTTLNPRPGFWHLLFSGNLP